MRATATLGSDDDLPTGEAGIAVRASYNKTTCRIDQYLEVGLLEFLRDDLAEDALEYNCSNRCKVDVLSMLSRKHNRFDGNRDITTIADTD